MPGVVAVIATFRPPNLDPLVEATRPQVDAILVADDASPVTADAVLRDLHPLVEEMRRFERNAGIGRSLNAGLDLARERGASWLLTLDQDSLPGTDHVTALLRTAAAGQAAGHAVGAVGVGTVVGHATEFRIPTTAVDGLEQAEELVQAGTIWSVAALDQIGGFDASLGMDAVDAAAGIRLQRAGFRLLVAPGLALRHEIGDARPVQVLGRTVQATDHSPARRESILRNRIRLAPEAAGVSLGYAVRTVRRAAVGAVLASTVEQDRWAKAKGSLRALLPRRSQ